MHAHTHAHTHTNTLSLSLAHSPPPITTACVQSLLSLLLPQHIRLRAQVMEVLDMDLIRQKMQNDAFDIFFYANYVVGTMARLCAPVRDEKVAALNELKDVVPLFR